MATDGMRYSLVPLAIAMTCLVREANAQSSVVIYGRLNTAIEYSKATTATDGTRLGGTGRLTNNRSVFGLTGVELLGYGLKAIWQIESTLSIGITSERPIRQPPSPANSGDESEKSPAQGGAHLYRS